MSVSSEVFSDGAGGGEQPNHAASPHSHGLPKTVTMAGVAKIAGISQGAISSLLNDRDYGIRVSPNTRARVFKICRDLGYVPNDLRAVVRIYPELGETCLLVSDKIPGGIANPFIARLTAALMSHTSQAAASIGVILYDEKRDYGVPGDLPSPLQNGTASKVFCVGVGNESICRVVHERTLPALMLGHTSHIPGTTSIVPDYAEAARLAVDLFVRLGHAQMGIVSGPFGSHEPRFSELHCAIRDAAGQAGIVIDDQNVFAGNLTFEAGVAALQHMLALPSRPTALLCLSEDAAAGVLAAAQIHGIRVPAELSVITFADHAGTNDSLVPLTSVVLPVDEMASIAARESDRRIRGGLPADAAKITVGVRLIERETSGPVHK